MVGPTEHDSLQKILAYRPLTANTIWVRIMFVTNFAKFGLN